VNLVIWLGIAYYLFKLDRKITRLEQEEGREN
jgi:CcmD family protein